MTSSSRTGSGPYDYGEGSRSGRYRGRIMSDRSARVAAGLGHAMVLVGGLGNHRRGSPSSGPGLSWGGSAGSMAGSVPWRVPLPASPAPMSAYVERESDERRGDACGSARTCRLTIMERRRRGTGQVTHVACRQCSAPVLLDPAQMDVDEDRSRCHVRRVGLWCRSGASTRSRTAGRWSTNRRRPTEACSVESAASADVPTAAA